MGKINTETQTQLNNLIQNFFQNNYVGYIQIIKQQLENNCKSKKA